MAPLTLEQQALCQQKLLLEYQQLIKILHSTLSAQHEMDVNTLLSEAKRHSTHDIIKLAYQLEQTDAALCAIHLDLYGLCVDCESNIDAAILLQTPTQPRCTECQTHDHYHHNK